VKKLVDESDCFGTLFDEDSEICGACDLMVECATESALLAEEEEEKPKKSSKPSKPASKSTSSKGTVSSPGSKRGPKKR